MAAAHNHRHDERSDDEIEVTEATEATAKRGEKTDENAKSGEKGGSVVRDETGKKPRSARHGVSVKKEENDKNETKVWSANQADAKVQIAIEKAPAVSVRAPVEKAQTEAGTSHHEHEAKNGDGGNDTNGDEKSELSALPAVGESLNENETRRTSVENDTLSATTATNDMTATTETAETADANQQTGGHPNTTTSTTKTTATKTMATTASRRVARPTDDTGPNAIGGYPVVQCWKRVGHAGSGRRVLATVTMRQQRLLARLLELLPVPLLVAGSLASSGAIFEVALAG